MNRASAIGAAALSAPFWTACVGGELPSRPEDRVDRSIADGAIADGASPNASADATLALDGDGHTDSIAALPDGAGHDGAESPPSDAQPTDVQTAFAADADASNDDATVDATPSDGAFDAPIEDDVASVAARTWQPTGPMVEARQDHTATLLADGTVLVVGGDDVAIGFIFQGAKATAEIYDPASAMFFPNGQMSVARTLHRATRLDDGTVLVTGGLSPDCALSSAELYVPTTRTFVDAGLMTDRRYEHTTTVLDDGRVLIAGGSSAGANCSDGGTLASAEIYDPATGAFSSTGAMMVPRFRHAAVLLPDGRVLITGGHAFGANNGLSGELYDPDAGAFGPAGNMTYARERHSATRTATGAILIAGGLGASNSTAGTSELYEVGTNAFKLPELIGADQTAHADVALPGGEVLLVGGGTATTSIWDPRTSTWFTGNPMSVSRSSLAAAMLSDGRVLATGGATGTSITNSAEIF